jgi:hypothetical protein
MLVRLLIIAASALAGSLGTLFLRDKVAHLLPGDEEDAPPMPMYGPYRSRARRATRTHLDARPDGESVPQ